MPDIITLKAICEELKVDPREARKRLRAATSDAKANPELAKARKPRTPWQWVKVSKALGEPIKKPSLVDIDGRRNSRSLGQI